MNIQGTVSTWGNGHAIRIPKSLLESIGLKADDKVNISIEESQIVITPILTKPAKLVDLFAGYTGVYQCSEWDIGEPVGKEVF